MTSALVASLALASSPAYAATWWTYFNGNTKQGIQKLGTVGNIGGGSAQATIGEVGNSYIRTYNVFGDKVHETMGQHSDQAYMTHTIRYDGRSGCIWKAKVPAASTTALPMICRDYRY